ncbi:hypothetical protein ACRALDRAFT_210592 [Sodiomyces alcalophilus JCM 7366]|uniref:uncharacterized protein n=1 Tax=Sodiomyces alcalophilus JCM 7366 TaxID=591952 RepID=UPI0039B4759F
MSPMTKLEKLGNRKHVLGLPHFSSTSVPTLTCLINSFLPPPYRLTDLPHVPIFHRTSYQPGPIRTTPPRASRTVGSLSRICLALAPVLSPPFGREAIT